MVMARVHTNIMSEEEEVDEGEVAKDEAKESMKAKITDRETLFSRIEQLVRLVANWKSTDAASNEGGCVPKGYIIIN